MAVFSCCHEILSGVFKKNMSSDLILISPNAVNVPLICSTVFSALPFIWYILLSVSENRDLLNVFGTLTIVSPHSVVTPSNSGELDSADFFVARIMPSLWCAGE